MAKMFSEAAPQNTGSNRAEPNIYWRLANQLSEDFIVIHSLPWLATVAREIDGRFVPTGEIDFLVLHRKLGILAIEVKGGIFKYDKTKFVYKRTKQTIDPIRQVRRGTHALAKWLHESGAGGWKIGYCILFPDSEIREHIPISLIDQTVQPSQPIVLDIQDLDTLAKRIQEIMNYWKKSLNTWEIREEQLDKLIDVILPSADYTPCWQTRINNDIVTWLKLTPEQEKCLKKIENEFRLVISGFSGTGKTLLLIEHARKSVNKGKRVLVLTYNSLLAKYLQSELSDLKTIDVCTFHELCRKACKLTQNSIPERNSSSVNNNNQEWYSTIAPNALQQAVSKGLLSQYESLIVDEGQVIQLDWWDTLTEWFRGKQIIVFCDETQVFSFETATSAEEISDKIAAKSPYILTINLRSPRTVFERIQQVRVPEYQQFSPRPHEPDTLEEIIVHDPINTSIQVVENLCEEGVNKDY